MGAESGEVESGGEGAGDEVGWLRFCWGEWGGGEIIGAGGRRVECSWGGEMASFRGGVGGRWVTYRIPVDSRPGTRLELPLRPRSPDKYIYI